MNAFSMFYSHMMDTSSRHPLLFQSPNSNDMQQEQEALVDFLPKSSDIFTKKIHANLMVLISGVSSPQGKCIVLNMSWHKVFLPACFRKRRRKKLSCLLSRYPFES